MSDDEVEVEVDAEEETKLEFAGDPSKGDHGSSSGTEPHEEVEEDAFEKLSEERDGLKRKLKAAQQLLRSAGFDLADDGDEQEKQHAKRLKRINGWCDKNGGSEGLEKLLKARDKRMLSDYVHVVCARVHVSPGDIVMVHWGYPEECLSYGVVCGQPQPGNELEVRVEFAGLKESTVACVPPREELIEPLQHLKLEEQLDQVFALDNMRVLFRSGGKQGQTLAQFVGAFWKATCAKLMHKHDHLRGRLTGWGKKWEARVAASGHAVDVAPPPPPPPPQPSLESVVEARRVGGMGGAGGWIELQLKLRSSAAASGGLLTWVKREEAHEQHPAFRQDIEACVTALLERERVALQAAKPSGIPVEQLIQIIRQHPECKAQIQAVVSDSGLAEPAKMAKINDIVKVAKRKENPEVIDLGDDSDALPPPPPPPPPQPQQPPPKPRLLQAQILMYDNATKQTSKMPHVKPPHGTNVTFQVTIPPSFRQGIDRLERRPWGGPVLHWGSDEKQRPGGKWWWEGKGPGAQILVDMEVYNADTILFRKGAKLRDTIHQEYRSLAGDWVTREQRKGVHTVARTSTSPQKKYMIEFPEDTRAGDTFYWKVNDACVKFVPPKPGEEGFKVVVNVKVPDGKRSQCTFDHVHTDGHAYKIRVPHGLKGGDDFQHTIELKEPRTPATGVQH